MDTKNKKAMDSQENKVAKEVNGPPGLDHRGKVQNTEQRNDKKVVKERKEPKGLPHQQVPQPLVDFSSEALVQIWYLQYQKPMFTFVLFLFSFSVLWGNNI